MNSKESLERLYSYLYSLIENEEDLNNIKLDYLYILRDLVRLERLKAENAELKEVIKLLKDNLQLTLITDIDPLINSKLYIVRLLKNYKMYSGFETTQEKFELLRKVFGYDK